MYETILLPVDGSDAGNVAIDHARSLADAYDATVHALFVADTTRDSVTRLGGQVVDALEQEGEEATERVASRLESAGISVQTAVEQGDPHPTIVDYADRHDADLVVMATHGRRGLERYLLGSTTERVLRHTDRPVLTVRAHDD